MKPLTILQVVNALLVADAALTEVENRISTAIAQSPTHDELAALLATDMHIALAAQALKDAMRALRPIAP